MRRQRGVRLAVAALGLPLACAVRAQGVPDGFNFGVDAGIGESDNVTLVDTGRLHQTFALADLDFSLQEKGSRLVEDVVGDFTYLDFLQHAYSNELLGHLNGTLSYALLPDSLTWTLQDNWGQAQVNPFGPLTPSNLQNINYLTTGPDWYARLGSTTFLDVTGRYARSDYQAASFASNRYIGSLQLGEELSAHSSASLVGTFQRVTFDNTTLNPDYDLGSVYGRYELHGARTDLSANLGGSRISSGGTSNTGALGQLQLTRKLSSAASLVLSAGRQLTDASAEFNSLQTAGATPNAVNVNSPANAAPAPVSASVFTSDFAAAEWRYLRNRTTLSVSGRVERDHYVDQSQFDANRRRFDLDLERKLSRALSVQAFGSISHTRYGHEDFLAANPSYGEEDGLYGLSLVVREGRGLEFKLRYDHMQRDVSAGNSVPRSCGVRQR